MLEKLLFLGHHPAVGGSPAAPPAPVTGQAISESSGIFSPLTIIIILVLIALGIAFWFGRKKK